MKIKSAALKTPAKGGGEKDFSFKKNEDWPGSMEFQGELINTRHKTMLEWKQAIIGLQREKTALQCTWGPRYSTQAENGIGVPFAPIWKFQGEAMCTDDHVLET